jgi:rubredoxin
MERYKCEICGYIYNPEEGDPESGIEPGTSFIDLPENYKCPICGAGKEEFFIYD